MCKMKKYSLYRLAPYRKCLGLLCIGLVLVGVPLCALLRYLTEVEKIPQIVMSFYIGGYLITAISLALMFAGAIVADDELTFERQLQLRYKR
jgi:hypothetical protein